MTRIPPYSDFWLGLWSIYSFLKFDLTVRIPSCPRKIGLLRRLKSHFLKFVIVSKTTITVNNNLFIFVTIESHINYSTSFNAITRIYRNSDLDILGFGVLGLSILF